MLHHHIETHYSPFGRKVTIQQATTAVKFVMCFYMVGVLGNDPSFTG